MYWSVIKHFGIFNNMREVQYAEKHAVFKFVFSLFNLISFNFLEAPLKPFFECS